MKAGASIFLTFFMTIPFLLLSSCSSQPSLVLSRVDHGSEVEIKEGGVITITLESNPSTGYTWQAKDLDPAHLELIGEPEFESTQPEMIGAPGTLTLRFITLAAGQTTLKLVHLRPWEEGVDPIDVFSVIVTIR